MKKLIGVAVAVALAFAFTAWAEQKAEVKVKETTKGGTTEVKAVDKVGKTETKVDVQKTGTTVTGTIDAKSPSAKNVVDETVQFEKYDAQGDYIYVVKDNKVIRAKHTLNDSMKKDMLTLKKGDAVKITSTYPLTVDQVATITALQKTEKSPAVQKAMQAVTPAQKAGEQPAKAK